MKKLLSVVLCLLPVSGFAQGQDFSNVEITTHRLADNLYYLEGQGGNIGVSVGEDGVFIIDDQFAPLTDRIIDAIQAVSPEPVRFVLNTHYHGDHTGGNQNLGKAGAIIVAHDNVRTILAEQMNGGDIDALSMDQKAGLPAITFSGAVDFHLNGEHIHAFHIGPGHTDGDSFVHFRNANVIHTGDVFRTTGYPVVDANANGSFFGIVQSYELLLDISNPDTVFVPGHGVPSSQDDIREQLDMFYTIRDRIQSGIDSGMSLERIQASSPTREYDARWDGGRIKGPDVVAVVYNELMVQ